MVTLFERDQNGDSAIDRAIRRGVPICPKCLTEHPLAAWAFRETACVPRCRTHRCGWRLILTRVAA